MEQAKRTIDLRGLPSTSIYQQPSPLRPEILKYPTRHPLSQERNGELSNRYFHSNYQADDLLMQHDYLPPFSSQFLEDEAEFAMEPAYAPASFEIPIGSICSSLTTTTYVGTDPPVTTSSVFVRYQTPHHQPSTYDMPSYRNRTYETYRSRRYIDPYRTSRHLHIMETHNCQHSLFRCAQ